MNTIIVKLGLVALLSTAAFGCVAGDSTDEAGATPSEPIATGEEPLLSFSSQDFDPDDVYIERITTGGPGCRDNDDVSAEIAEDRKSFLLIFDKMVLENPPGPTIKNINCVAGVKLHVPSGLQVSMSTVTTRGYAYLPVGVRARQTSSYFFAGMPIGTSYHSQLRGFYDDNYQFTDHVPFASVVWSRCGESAIFAVNTQLNLNAVANAHSSAYFNAETVDGRFEKIFHLQWREC